MLLNEASLVLGTLGGVLVREEHGMAALIECSKML